MTEQNEKVVCYKPIIYLFERRNYGHVINLLLRAIKKLTQNSGYAVSELEKFSFD